MKPLVDDFVARGYFGIILTGGEPTLHPELPQVVEYARTQGLHVRMITNGHRLSEPDFTRDLADAGLQLVHISVYSVNPEIEARLRGAEGTLERAFAAVGHAHRHGIEVNINCVINRLNADHLDANIAYWMREHPYVRHFIWNNLDPSMGRAEVNQEEFTPRMADFELSLHRAMRMLDRTGRTFRVEKVPLCYMSDYGWASTETRKIVKGEERIVHFLDAKQTIRQTDWGHLYAESCGVCSLRTICGGLFDRGGGYDPAELSPVFADRDALVKKIINDPSDPSYQLTSIDAWHEDFDRRLHTAQQEATKGEVRDRPIPVGRVTGRGQRLYQAKRRQEGRKADAQGVSLETESQGPSGESV